MKVINKREIIILMMSVLLVLSIILSVSLSALLSNKSVKGVVVFSSKYALVVAESSNPTQNLQTSSISFDKKVLSADVVANVELTQQSQVSTNSINNGSIVGNFYKYSWGIDDIDLDSQSLIYKVFADNDFSFYPQLKISISYKSENFGGVHLSFRTQQDNVYSIVDSMGQYYSYYVKVGDYNYLITYPTVSTLEDGYYLREVTCFVLDEYNQPMKFIGQGADIASYTLNISDIIDGVYFEDSYTYDASLNLEFSLDTNFVI